ncbi:MAG: alpha/beta fold hydrolase [Lachnospiraceae bacterium]|nr:alpha/beta hydrolase [Lachnospiraceae bacterium]MDY3223669.1 alpha/beta fold hydrolase [Lachnospiraceae bacterium]
MKYREFVYRNKIIRGFFYEGTGREVVIVVHGFTGNKVDHHRMLKTFTEEIVSCGYAAYRFDFLGSGDSDGEFFEEEGIVHRIDQMQYLVDEFKKEGYKVHFMGFSLGGVICAHTAKTRRIESMVLLSPAGNFPEIIDQMCGDIKGIPEVNGFQINPKFIEEAKSFPYFEGIEDCCSLIKLIQGTKDQYVSMESLENFQRSFPESETVMVKGADHCYSSVRFTETARKEIKNFYGKISQTKKI